jgi:hypothetical protein
MKNDRTEAAIEHAIAHASNARTTRRDPETKL